MNDPEAPPLRPLHTDAVLVRSKIELFERISTESLKLSLAPGQAGCLKTRPDGTVLDGHHRIYILRRRGVNVDQLARTVIERQA